MLPNCGRHAIGAAYDKCNILTHRLPVIELARKLATGVLPATLVEQDHLLCRLDFRENFFPFGIHGAVCGTTLVPLCGADFLEAKSPLPRHSPGIFRECGIDPGWLPITDGNQANVHLSPVSCSAIFSRLHRPEFFQVIEFPDPRQHHMDQRIPEVEKNPLATFFTLNT